jgi:serine/threonine protein kinase/regulation of enolase protein 1 (concanavalin A-like superfamily)
MIPRDSDRKPAPRASQNGQCGTQDPEETGCYPPAASWPPAATVPGGPSSGHERIDFLGPPRAAGELGSLAHYRVLRLLGEGGMGLVFLAEDSLLSRPVALKVIRPEIADTPGIAQRFTREARATAAIKHDHIVTIYQVGQENGIPFLAMEYLKGLSLAQWFDRGQRPSVELVLRIGREIAAGLSAAHRQSLIHRDIKPANIWLEAPSGRVKILDFGMARSEREDIEITRSGAVMGTPAYMAPEQARGELVGASSDLFSLGCVMYRLCTSRLPFEGESIMAVLTALSTTTPPGPLELRPGIPPGLDELVMRLLAKDPSHRLESAEFVVKEIRAIERDLLAQRQKAQLSAAAPPTGAVETSDEVPRELGAETSPAQLVSTSHTRRRTLVITAVVLLALAATAAVSLAFVPRRASQVENLAVGPRSAPAHARGGVAPTMPPKTAAARTSQPVAISDKLSPPVVSGVVAQPSSLASSQIPPSNAAAKPGLRDAPRVSPHEQPAENLAKNEKKLGNDRPTGSIAVEARAPEAPSRRARGMDAWGNAVDPDGDCKFEFEERSDKVRIIVPGNTHILSADIGRMNAPRILRDVHGDFDLSVRIAGTSRPGGKATTTWYSPYHGAGLLVWQDQENYVRLEIASDIQYGKVSPYVNFEYRKAGALAVTSGIKNGDGSKHLRLRRRGGEIYAAFGPDGVRWTSFSPLTATLNDRLTVGVVAINSSTKPLTAEFENFNVLESEDLIDRHQ